jgi:hypothetical protein
MGINLNMCANSPTDWWYAFLEVEVDSTKGSCLFCSNIVLGHFLIVIMMKHKTSS